MSISHPAAPLPTSVVRGNRIKLLLLLGVFAAPLVVGTLLYFFWTPSSTRNYGELLNPPPNVHGLTVQQITPGAQPKPLGFKTAYHGKWVMLISGDAACPSAKSGVCLDRVEVSRKIRTLLGKHQARLNRVAHFGTAPALAAMPDDEQLVLTAEPAAATPLAELLRQGHFYIVDPFGHVILKYPPDADHKLVLKDLDRLMKYSPIG
jgi:hypothetical protein